MAHQTIYKNIFRVEGRRIYVLAFDIYGEKICGNLNPQKVINSWPPPVQTLRNNVPVKNRVFGEQKSWH